MNVLWDRTETIAFSKLLRALVELQVPSDDTVQRFLNGQEVERVHLHHDALKQFYRHCQRLQKAERETGSNASLASMEIQAAAFVLYWIMCIRPQSVTITPPTVGNDMMTSGIDLQGLAINWCLSEAASLHQKMYVLLVQSIRQFCPLYSVSQVKQPLYIARQRIVYDDNSQAQSALCILEREPQLDKQTTNGNHPVYIHDHSCEHIDEQMTVLQTNVDDVNPEILPAVMQRLLNAGANDAYMQPLQMKKGRTGILLHVLCSVHRVQQMERIIFQETGTLGIRRLPVAVHRLGRFREKMNTPWGLVHVKKGIYEGEVVTVSAEFDDCLTLAEAHNIPVRTVMEWVQAQVAKGGDTHNE